MKQTILFDVFRKIRQKANSKKYNQSKKGKEANKRNAKKHRILHSLEQKIKCFTLFSDTEENGHYSIECRIQGDGRFRNKGILNFYEKIMYKNEPGMGRDKAKRLINIRKHRSKRRQLGFIELNEHFEGSEAHHINKEFVLHIPEKLHHSIKHNIWNGENMEEINNKALAWAYGI